MGEGRKLKVEAVELRKESRREARWDAVALVLVPLLRAFFTLVPAPLLRAEEVPPAQGVPKALGISVRFRCWRAGMLAATVDVAATEEVAALISENNAKGRFISCSRQLVAGPVVVSSSRLDVLGAKNARNLPTIFRLVFPRPGGRRLESRRISNEGCR